MSLGFAGARSLLRRPPQHDSDDLDCGAGSDDYADLGVGVDDPPSGCEDWADPWWA